MPPKADIRQRIEHVCFVPQADPDMASAKKQVLLLTFEAGNNEKMTKPERRTRMNSLRTALQYFGDPVRYYFCWAVHGAGAWNFGRTTDATKGHDLSSCFSTSRGLSVTHVANTPAAIANHRHTANGSRNQSLMAHQVSSRLCQTRARKRAPPGGIFFQSGCAPLLA